MVTVCSRVAFATECGEWPFRAERLDVPVDVEAAIAVGAHTEQRAGGGQMVTIQIRNTAKESAQVPTEDGRPVSEQRKRGGNVGAVALDIRDGLPPQEGRDNGVTNADVRRSSFCICQRQCAPAREP